MNLNDLQTWHYVVIGGGALLVLSVILYFLPVKKLKIPGMLVAAVGGLAVGLAGGVIWLAGYGYKPNDEQSTAARGDEGGGPPSMAPGMPKGMGKGGGMPKGGGGMPKGGFGGTGGPNARTQLMTLVTALDRLVDKQLSITLSADDRAAIAAQLKGLSTASAISDEDAKARVDAILKILEKDRPALEAAGFRGPPPEPKGPAKGGFGPPKESPNPFHDGPVADHLKSLQQRLDKK